MTVDHASALVQETIRISLWVSGPILATAMLSGLLISILQAATQVNEQTLSFVPKIVLTMLVFGVLFPWMMGSMVEFGERILLEIAFGGSTMMLDLPTELLWTLPLAGVRVLALTLVAPVLGHAAVPMRIRVAAGMLIALAIAPLAPATAAASDPSLAMAAMVGSEALIGFTIGFGLRVIFGVFAPLGEVISIQGGLGAATVLDPSSGSSSAALGVLLQVFGLIVFLALDGHHALLRGVAASYQRLPIGELALSSDAFRAVAALGSSVFEMTARLAAPVTIVMLVVNVGVGILGRSIPQLNLMALQLPAHIAITLIILGLAANPLADSIGMALTGFTEGALADILGGR